MIEAVPAPAKIERGLSSSQLANLVAIFAVVLASFQTFVSWRSLQEFKDSKLYEKRLDSCVAALVAVDQFATAFGSWKFGVGVAGEGERGVLQAALKTQKQALDVALTQVEILGPDDQADRVMVVQRAMYTAMAKGPFKTGAERAANYAEGLLASSRDNFYDGCVKIAQSAPSADAI